MAQIKVYGLKGILNPIKERLSDVIHSCVVDALQYPVDKRVHRFFPLDEENFIYKIDRSEKYTIIEISMFEGRSVESKKKLLQLLFERIHTEFDILPHDVEITIFETPKHNWGIRGVSGDELELNYKVNV
ncbi:tautomerase family protein [Bacillus sp. 03113]|uniref:tautomerase family protein n=1 Tax=Bacillus sp. 03113 TaxID=2578211 RepID=UPI001143C74B|nr:tautomerase family protein [Bacillus sp. 03113]